MKAKAMIVTEPNKIEMGEFEVVAPAANQILIKTKVTSICSTDIKVFHGLTPLARYPLIMGHEFCGEVVEMGSQAREIYKGIEVGDTVTPEPYITCGQCSWCHTDHFYHNCPNGASYGVSMSSANAPHLFGGYAQYVYLIPVTMLYKVAPGVPDLAACLSSVVGNGVRWIKTLGGLSFGQSLVISGVGSQGLCALIAAKEAGVKPVVMLGLSQDKARFELATQLGADHVVMVDREDPRERVPQLIGGQADMVLETSGVPEAINTAIDLVRTAGRVVVIGLSGGKETPVAFDKLVWRDIVLATGKGQAGNVADAMRLINSRAYPFEKINNFHYKLEDLEQALADTAKPPEGFIKGAVIFD